MATNDFDYKNKPPPRGDQDTFVDDLGYDSEIRQIIQDLDSVSSMELGLGPAYPDKAPNDPQATPIPEAQAPEPGFKGYQQAQPPIAAPAAPAYPANPQASATPGQDTLYQHPASQNFGQYPSPAYREPFPGPWAEGDPLEPRIGQLAGTQALDPKLGPELFSPSQGDPRAPQLFGEPDQPGRGFPDPVNLGKQPMAQYPATGLSPAHGALPTQPGYGPNASPLTQPGYGPNASPLTQPGYGPNASPLPQPGYGTNASPLPQPGYGPNAGPLTQPGYGTNASPLPQPGYGTNASPLPQPGYGTNASPLPQPGYVPSASPLPQPGYGTAPVLTAREPIPVPRPPADNGNTLLLTEKLDFDQQAANGVIDLVDEVNEGSQAQQAQGQTRVRDLTVAELGRLIESAVERAIRKSRE